MPQPHLSRVQRTDMPQSLQGLWDMGQNRTGDATIIEVMANHPEILRWYFEDFYEKIFYNNNKGMLVDIRTKELLRLKLSKQHGCQFCNRSNTIDALAVGITQAQVDGILSPTPGLFDEKDLAIIDLASEMMLQNMHGELKRELYDRLRRYYTDAQLIEIGFVAAILTGMAKYIFTFDVVDREETCPIRPAEFVNA